MLCLGLSSDGMGGNGCAMHAGPVLIGTSIANMLILLIPVLVIGLRALIKMKE